MYPIIEETGLIPFLQKSCPNLWSILNQKAKQDLPQGFKEFLSGDYSENGKVLLQQIDKKIATLIHQLSQKVVGDNYRRDLSGADGESKLAQFFCEISLVSSLSLLSAKQPLLHPKSGRGETECDVKVYIEGFDVYGDSKRLEDKWQGGKRSIVKSPTGMKPKDSKKPRSMDIYSKLKDVPIQFPQNTLNIVFLFHHSIWNSSLYIPQALYGDDSSFKDSSPMCLQDDGLYAIEEWKNISGCCHSQVSSDGTFSILAIWKNPRATVSIPEEVSNKLKEAT